LRPEVKIFDLIKSLFPCGSVTGAPKIQSMKIIRALEKEPRNIYTGAIGYFSPDGQAVFNVAIRTIDLQLQMAGKYSAAMGVGGGIVFDSQSEEEYSECRIKAQFLVNSIPDFALIETMLLDNCKIRYLDQHLRRLKVSAHYFGIPCVITAIKKDLLKYAESLSGKIRLRLLLKPSGEINLEHKLLVAASAEIPAITLSCFKTRSNDHFLYHKTTHRKLYDVEYNQSVAKGYFDVIFMNEKNEITEGAISNIFVRMKDRYYTPPLSCGLLNGIQRQVMMKKLKSQEKILYLKDLKKADKIILTNSIRGATEVIIG
jgi:para-aminobenzoate synthetase / 4-amino-4-deoxychorismate lyase